jgi:hypothetical protein
MTSYVGNAFSLGMLAPGASAALLVTPVEPAAARQFAEFAVSIVGHADTAALFSTLLGCPVAHNRATAILSPGDTLLVGQYTGPRLPEGAVTLPEGATVRWFSVTVFAVN